MSILARRSDRNPPPRASRGISATRISPPDRHWFIPDPYTDFVYCAACGLPEANGRHATKAVG